MITTKMNLIEDSDTIILTVWIRDNDGVVYTVKTHNATSFMDSSFFYLRGKHIPDDKVNGALYNYAKHVCYAIMGITEG